MRNEMSVMTPTTIVHTKKKRRQINLLPFCKIKALLYPTVLLSIGYKYISIVSPKEYLDECPIR